MRTRHILFFGHRPYPNDHAALECVFTHYLPVAGYQTVWVLQPKTAIQAGVRTQWNGTPVYVTAQRAWAGPLKHLHVIRNYLRVGSAALREYPIDIVQARTGLAEALAAWWLAKYHHKPFVFQYSFPVPLSRREQIKRSPFPWLARPIFKVESWLVHFLMRQAVLVLAISRNMSDTLRESGIDHVVPFPLGVDLSIEPTDIEPVDMPTDTIIYFGAMDRTRKLEFLLDVFALVRQSVPTAHLLLLGNGAVGDLERYARHLGLLEAVTFVERVPRSHVPRYIKAARCSVAPIPPEPVYMLSSPAKVVESLGMGIPVVANREIHDQRELIEQSGGGYAPPYDPLAFANAIVKLLCDPQGAAQRGTAGREYVAAHRSYEVLSQQLIDSYEQHVLAF